MPSISRNAPCPCGSGKKYKQCCLKTGGVQKGRRTRRIQVLAVLLVVAAVACSFLFGKEVAFTVAGGGALALGAYVYLLSDPPPPGKGGSPGAINFGR